MYSDIYQMIKRKNSQGHKTKDLLIKAALHCLVEDGIHSISFQSIAKKSGFPQPLVAYHFKKVSKIFPTVWDYIYDIALKRTESSLSHAGSAKEKLSNYLKISIEIFSESKEITIIYFQLQYLAIFDEKLKSINTQIKNKAVNRVAEILQNGQQTKEFKSDFDPYLTAKAIHSSLVGILINSITDIENFELNKVLSTFERRIFDSLI
ncbi:MAG: TetR/AcrR family transcriptional regulator [Deltaproteobacteria bacterium]|nr:TetR/AcrR family transcriptional regulator [Deltaproteobacteria bacterium]